MAGILNNSSCGFAKVTVHLCNVNKPFFKNGNKDEILDETSTTEEKYARYLSFFEGRDDYRVDDMQAFRNGMLRLKGLVAKLSKHKSADKKCFFAKFSPENFVRLNAADRGKHRLYNCMECVNNPDYKKAISMLNQNGKPAKKNTQAKIPNVAQVAAMEELSKLNEQFCHTFKQSFSSIITNIPDSHIIMKPTKSEKEKKKRQLLRNAAKCLEGQWHETVVERGLGIRQSFQSRNRERIVRSFEDKENAINRSNVRKNREAKGLIEKKDHVGDVTKMNWNKEDFLKDVENLEFSLTEVNWSDMARKYEVIDGSGELAKNGGQIIKEYARSSGIDVDSISKKRKNGNPIVRKCKKRFISSCVSVPVDCSNIQLKTELGKRIESGEFSIGVPIT